jgi:hypothetical protein
MLKAFTILSPLMPQMIHNPCLAHIYNLVGEALIDHENFKLLDTFIYSIKTLFVYSSARKRRWITYLNINAVLNPTLPPLPVKTRWNSFFKFIFWCQPLFNHLINFFKEEENLNSDSKAIKKLIVIIENEEFCLLIDIIQSFITFNAKR